MNHQPYESWILDDEKLDRSQQVELEEHLRDCPKCNKLQQSWAVARMQIKSAPVRQPAAGFSGRWQQSLAERKRYEESRQTRNLLLGLSGTALLLLIILAVIFMPDFSLIGLTVSAITTIVNISKGLSTFMELVTSITRTAPPGVMILSVLILSTLTSVFCFIWGVSLWKLSRKGVKENEEN